MFHCPVCKAELSEAERRSACGGCGTRLSAGSAWAPVEGAKPAAAAVSVSSYLHAVLALDFIHRALQPLPPAPEGWQAARAWLLRCLLVGAGLAGATVLLLTTALLTPGMTGKPLLGVVLAVGWLFGPAWALLPLYRVLRPLAWLLNLTWLGLGVALVVVCLQNAELFWMPLAWVPASIGLYACLSWTRPLWRHRRWGGLAW